MNKSAEIITICPFELAEKLNILDYNADHYVDIAPDAEIITSFCFIYTNSYYADICKLLGVPFHKPGRQEVTLATLPTKSRVSSTNIEDELEYQDVYEKVSTILHAGYRVFLKVDF